MFLTVYVVIIIVVIHLLVRISKRSTKCLISQAAIIEHNAARLLLPMWGQTVYSHHYMLLSVFCSWSYRIYFSILLFIFTLHYIHIIITLPLLAILRIAMQYEPVVPILIKVDYYSLLLILTLQFPTFSHLNQSWLSCSSNIMECPASTMTSFEGIRLIVKPLAAKRAMTLIARRVSDTGYAGK